MNGQIVVRIFGPDPNRLRELAELARQAMAIVPGIVDLQTERQLLIPEINVEVDRARAAALGLNAGEVAEQAQQGLYGEVVGRVPLEGGPADVRVLLSQAARSDPEALRALDLVGPQGSRVTLGQVAEVREAAGQDYLNHDRGERFIAVTANVHGRDAGQVAAEIEHAIGNSVLLPPGYRVHYGGVWSAQQRAQRSILIFSALAVALIAAALLWHFRSLALTLQTLANIPLSLVGSAAALLLAHEKLSVATAVGFVTVCGIASRNTILLISHYLHLMEQEGEVFGRSMVVRGSLERLPPMLMTALTAGLAVLPLLIGRDQPGKEILAPVAIVIAGGLVSSTLLDLVVTPVAFLWFGRDAAESRRARNQRIDPAGAAVLPATPA
jgi:Cu/Ag efflux pump CusA